MSTKTTDNAGPCPDCSRDAHYDHGAGFWRHDYQKDLNTCWVGKAAHELRMTAQRDAELWNKEAG